MRITTMMICAVLGASLAQYAAAEKLSGYAFVKDETRAMQDDEFANPGLIAVERGAELFTTPVTAGGKTCAECHGDDGEKLDVQRIASYPIYDAEKKEIISLQRRISDCRSRIADDTLPVNHPDLMALETFVRNRAQGVPVNVQTEGAEIQALLKRGEALYETRYGLIDMSCHICHTVYAGQFVRGQKISQGQSNGFPAYRLGTGEMANLNLRITQCLDLMRAEPFPDDSEEIKLLEYYLSARSNGLPIETPAVRY
ncbi:MAG: sulfur oxidation c-type cytochrome SoxA [Gammaproteobacteria bacterium]|nr:sulfur oxidation c-type cytochrome SoxA [Gammaproteobacteria bacterium]